MREEKWIRERLIGLQQQIDKSTNEWTKNICERVFMSWS